MVDEALRGPAFLDGEAPPMILESINPRFIQTIRDVLSSRRRWPEIAQSRAKPREDGGTLRLYQPIHRTRYVALVEAYCKTTGEPRLDRSKLDSSGLVMRRVRGGTHERWVSKPDGTRGWEPVTDLTKYEDPDPARRPMPRQGLPELDRHLAALRGELFQSTESTTELFPMSRSVEEETGRLLLCGAVATASREASLPKDAPSFDPQDIIDDGFPDYFKTGASGIELPSKGGVIQRDEVRTRDDVGAYAAFLNKLVIAYDFKGPGPAALDLRARLEPLRVRYANGEERSLIVHLDQAAEALVFGRAASVTMPLGWPEISKSLQDELIQAVTATLQARHVSLAREENRFDDPNAEYVVLAFMRVTVEEGCPPMLVWSQETSNFRIAEWFEKGPAPSPIINLPDPLAGLDGFSPNVTFRVPASIANLLKANMPDKFIEGDLKSGGGVQILWLCGLNLPIVMLCAFIVLFIFLSLFNLFFWWLPFVRICIPLPVPKPSP